MSPRPPKKLTRRTRRRPSGIDAERLAISAIERIRIAVAELEGPHCDVVADEDPSLLHGIFAEGMPPSYQATLERACFVGPPENLLSPRQVLDARRSLSSNGVHGLRYIPFAKRGESMLCFDRNERHPKRELGVVEIVGSEVRPLATNFAEWLDDVAAAREETLERAAELPAKLDRLLQQMGFLRHSRALLCVTTSDREALAVLLEMRQEGDLLAMLRPGDVATIWLNSGTHSVSCTIGARTVTLDSSETFRWLRFFRDENFYGDETTPSHPDRVRDLRGRSPKGKILAGRECVATHFRFIAASGKPDNFALLGLGDGKNCLVLRVIGGHVSDEWRVDSPLIDVAILDDGSLWALSSEHHALRFTRSSVNDLLLPTLPKERRFRALAPTTDGLLVWGRRRIAVGSGLDFSLLHPAPSLARDERINALQRAGSGFVILVQGALAAGIARFERGHWEPIAPGQVLEGQWTAMDHQDGVSTVVSEAGELVHIRDSGIERVPWNAVGAVTSLCATSTATFAGTLGATIYVGPTGDVTAWANDDRTARKVVGVGAKAARSCVELGGGLVRLWQHGGFEPLDLSKW